MPVYDDSGQIRITILSSGVRAATERMPGLQSVSIGFWLQVGSRDETLAEVGATHFLEHLVFRGTRTRSGIAISHEIDALGGDVNAFTGKEHTCFHARVMVGDVPQAVDLLANLVCAATLADDAVEAERQVILREIGLYQDTGDVRVHWLWAESYFASHPLARSSLGSPGEVERLSAERLRHWYRTYYTPANLLITAVGGIDHEEFVELIEKTLRPMKDVGTAQPDRNSFLLPSQHLLDVHEQSAEQVHIVLGTATVPRNSPDRFAVGVVAEALGGGMGSRLYQEVREKRGLAYVVYSQPSYHCDHGTLELYLGTTTHRTYEAVEATIQEWTRFLSTGFEPGELDRQKDHLRRSVALSLENSTSRMNRLGKAMLAGAPVFGTEENMAAIAAVTAHQVERVLESILTRQCALVALGAGIQRGELAVAMRGLPGWIGGQ
jgi:predicted Zn-dependent peptidase